jgi:3-oxoacyl-[acyl-carrier-protein] synthase-3
MSAVTTKFWRQVRLPERVVPNEALTQFPPRRCRSSPRRPASRRAATRPTTRARPIGDDSLRQCLQRAGVAPDEIDVIILATSSPDRIQPATATRVQELIGARKAYAFDVGSVCSGAVFALHMADALIRSGGARRVLVVASELYSRSHLNRGTSRRAPASATARARCWSVRASLARASWEPAPHDGAGADLIQVPAGGQCSLRSDGARKQDAFF